MAEQGGARVYRSGDLEIDLQRRELRVGGAAAPLGGRAFDIIEVLVEAAGELVAKPVLMDRVWPNVAVGDNALQVHISAIRKALGADRTLLKTASGRGYRLLGSWTVRHQDATRQPVGLQRVRVSGDTRGTNLPAVVTPLVGRAAAVHEIQHLLSAYRVVTLTGPGGIGKTALALKVARRFRAGFEDGEWLVELSSLSDPDLVPSAVVRVLGLKLGSEANSAEAVARSIGEQQLLLVLDNSEHLIDAAATLAEKIVSLCPRTTILATSREVFRIEGEFVYRVPPLEVPAVGQEAPDRVLGHSAVELFIARTKALDPDFSDAANLPMIAAICRQLDGIPLAIEFAAARVATLGIRQVADGLRDRFTLLTSGRRTAVPRHRTLRATLDWSYELLTESEQSLLRYLAIFPAGFELHAAAYVMADLDGAGSRIANGIASLVSKSLVIPDRPAFPGRWRLFETTRAYALEKLTASGEIALASQRHAAFYRDLLVPRALNFGLRLPIEDLDLFDREIDNVRAAIDWCFSTGGDADLGVALTAAYSPVWLGLALTVELRERAERALRALEGGRTLSGRLRMNLELTLGIALIITRGPTERTRTALNAGLEFATRLNDSDAQVRGLWALWSLQFNAGECLEEAQSTAERLQEIAFQSSDRTVQAVALRVTGYTLQSRGRQREARDNLERALQPSVDENYGHRLFVYNQPLLTRAMLARSLWLQGFFDQAQHVAHEALLEAQAGEDKLTLCFVLALAVVPIERAAGNTEAARHAVRMLTEVAHKHSFTQYIVTANGHQANMAIDRGDFALGVSLAKTTLEACEREGWMARLPTYLAALSRGMAGLGELSEALGLVGTALARAERCGELWYLAELHRVEGELLLQAAAQTDAAERCFGTAVVAAQRQGALSWELRAALSMARLRVTQGRQGEARAVLAPVFDRFTEGFGTTDLHAARAMLDELQPNVVG